MRRTTVKLYMFSGSNTVLTARLMLDHKQIEYRSIQMLPGMHVFTLLALGFETMQVPALKIDGRRVQGTRWIARALDELVPERPLFPADPVRRRAVEDAERWGEELQNATRRVFYAAARRDRGAYRSVMTAERSAPKRLLVGMTAPLVVRIATGAHRCTDDAAREDLALLPERLDQIDAWIQDGLLDGRELNAADFQIAPNIAAMLLFDDLAGRSPGGGARTPRRAALPRPRPGRPASAMASRAADRIQAGARLDASRHRCGPESGRTFPRRTQYPVTHNAAVSERRMDGAPSGRAVPDGSTASLACDADVAPPYLCYEGPDARGRD